MPWVYREGPTVVGVELRALGPVGAVVDGRLVDLGPPKQRALFALLLSRVDRPVAVDTLIEELWRGEPPSAAMASLLVYVCNLRRVLEPHRPPRAPAAVLRTRTPGYVLDSRGAEVDVRQFARHAMAGYEALAGTDPDQALREFDAALGLWRGPAYADVRDAAWAIAEIARLEELRLSVIEGRFTALLELGAHQVTVAELEAHARGHPLREHGCELLVLALYRGGRQAEALGVLRSTRVRLAEELGIDPGPALQRLERDILIHAPTLDWHPPKPAPTTAPVRAQAQVPTGTAPPQLMDDEVFVGRESALQRLVDVLGAVIRGRGRVVLVAGEPGIGKTRLLRRFAELTSVPVVWGRCPEHVAAPPLWPWEQVLRAVNTRWPDRPVPDPVAELLSSQTPAMAELYDVTGAALRRFEAIGEYLGGGSDFPPLVVVLDDVHWADIASLRLLTHLAESVAVTRVLLVATYRPHESGGLAETLAALARVGAGRIELGGLSDEEAHALVQATAGREISAQTALKLRARTEGNPFFLAELVRLLASEQRLEDPSGGPVPPPVREVVLRRVARLPASTAALLSVAAVAGRDFDAQVVTEAASVDAEPALEAIDAAVAVGLVAEDEQRLGWFRFTHALVAEALYEATGRLRRARWHRRIGQAAARAWGAQDERAGEVARHWLLAAELDPATAAQAAAYAATAARVADARLAPEDAAELWRQALAAAELAGESARDVDRYPLLIGLATSLYRAGNPREGLPVFVQAMEQALAGCRPGGPADSDSSRLVTAAIAAMGASNWYPVNYGDVDERLIGVLERALLWVTDPVQRALVLSCLATARYYDNDPLGRAALSDEALVLARPTADAVSWAHVLHLRAMALNTPDYPEQCLQVITELLRLPNISPSLVAAGRLIRADWLVTLGRIPEATAEVDLVAPLVELLRAQPYWLQLGWARAGLLLLSGRWQEAEAPSRAAFDLSARVSWLGAQPCRLLQRWEAAFLTGRGADLVDELSVAADDTGLSILHNLLTMALVEAARPEEARDVLRRLAPSPRTTCGFTPRVGACSLRCDSARLSWWLGCAASCCPTGGWPAPHRRLWSAVRWPTSPAKAGLALGDPDAALADLAIAIEIDERMGALPWLAKAREAITRVQRLGAKPTLRGRQVR